MHEKHTAEESKYTRIEISKDAEQEKPTEPIGYIYMMADKPTYSELELRIRQLEIENAAYLKNEKSLIESNFEFLRHMENHDLESDIENLDSMFSTDELLENIQLSDLIDSKELQPMMEDFHKLTGILGAILDKSGKIVVAAGWQDICTKFHRCNRESAENCLKSDTILSNGVLPGKFKAYKCLNNLWDMATPIIVEGKHLGNFFIGQFLYDYETLDPEVFRRQAGRYGYSETEYMEALERVPRLSEATVNTAMSFYSKLAIIISQLSYSRIKLRHTIHEIKKAETTLRKQEENLRVTLHSIGDAVITTDFSGKITGMNPVAEQLTGWNQKDARDRSLPEVFRIVNRFSRETVENPVEKVLSTGKIEGLANHTVLIAQDGKEHQIADSGSPIRTSEGEILGVVLVFRDVTEEYALQEQLRQSQKLDAVGQLAAGIAHDFNNVLTGIMSSAQVLQSPMRNLDSKGLKYVDLIMQASIRAAGLTRKLLAFGRNNETQFRSIELNKILNDAISILYSTIDKKIKITCHTNARNQLILADLSALENVIINLGINASHAMTDGGQLKICTENVVLDQSYCDASNFKLKFGEYCKISISDTGSGIPAENLDKIFDPFFTTKEQGKGTGLGLTSVLGTIKVHNGEISVRSELGAGTTFDILLPVSHTLLQEDNEDSEQFRGSGSVLFVDDEELNRTVGIEILESMGYEVLPAENGQKAIEIFSQHHGDISLVVLDMIMPELDGYETFMRMKEIDENCKVIISSGYSKNEKIEAMMKAGLTGYINKPYTTSSLIKILKRVSEEK